MKPNNYLIASFFNPSVWAYNFAFYRSSSFSFFTFYFEFLVYEIPFNDYDDDEYYLPDDDEEGEADFYLCFFLFSFVCFYFLFLSDEEDDSLLSFSLRLLLHSKSDFSYNYLLYFSVCFVVYYSEELSLS